jgi:hypothetical protein
MTENTDPGDKTLENSTNHESDNNSDLKSHDSGTEKIIPKQDTKLRESKDSKQYRASSKKFRHYFFEFLMLFLAVFCGFFADNLREQLQEQQREKEYINSIVEDIKSDTLNSNRTLLQLNRIKSGIDSVLNLLISPEIVDNSNDAYTLWTESLGLEVFVSNDRTIQQLKSSGELRLIRNKAVSDSIMKYDQTLKKYYTQSDLMYSAILDVTDYSQLFDFINLHKNPNIPVALTEQGKKSLNQAYAHLQLWNRGLIGLISWLERVNEEAINLVTFIQKEYKLE